MIDIPYYSPQFLLISFFERGIFTNLPVSGAGVLERFTVVQKKKISHTALVLHHNLFIILMFFSKVLLLPLLLNSFKSVTLLLFHNNCICVFWSVFIICLSILFHFQTWEWSIILLTAKECAKSVFLSFCYWIQTVTCIKGDFYNG